MPGVRWRREGGGCLGGLGPGIGAEGWGGTVGDIPRYEMTGLG